LAGAFISQIGNVGPSLGQNYIVDCFMTVVVGGVGNLAGTIYSALGIGLVDQSLQQILLNPVLGKILGMAGALARQQGLDDGFRTVINTGRVGRQEVYHLHLHVLGGPDPLNLGLKGA
jgi:hypothetical protein